MNFGLPFNIRNLLNLLIFISGPNPCCISLRRSSSLKSDLTDIYPSISLMWPWNMYHGRISETSDSKLSFLEKASSIFSIGMTAELNVLGVLFEPKPRETRIIRFSDLYRSLCQGCWLMLGFI